MEEERKLILKMVEDGKISPEDGTKLLKAMNSDDGEKQMQENSSPVSGPDSGGAGQEKEKTEASTETSLPTRAAGSRQDRRSGWDTEWDREKQKDHAGAATGFSDFIDSAVRKIKELDLDFNFGPYQEVHHIFQHKNMEQTSLDISLENGSLEWKPWDEADVKLECDVKVYKSRTQEEARQEFLKETVFEVDDTHLRFYTRTKAMKVDAVMYVPRRTYESLHLYTFNGHLRGEDVKVNSFSAKAVNGSLTIEQPDTMKCHLETVNGPVKVTGGRVDVGDVKTMNGTIELNSNIRDLEAESVNGTIDALMGVTQDARAALSATTGSIFVTVPPEIRTEGHLRTNVGNYNYSLSDMEIHEEKKDFIQKSLRFTSNMEASPRLRLNAQTKTGSISLKPEDS
ncbi:DUF4097 family beta strand repeat-containing protein [Salibacterium qingdaonense]|uniref:DUF4097 and DUF4098 domain-containing protein YvlB n=1 Tax=Salibacterium qingdaonense TaxID=266892 RepID=A0A1I4KXJ3_9BACI|nr:DUF4097 domain-containing protein [Salibacterium qingdaonense]SFL83485.1 DUF4097 and DUF4098 domain-containing protein YvlB [Salibacterium qingdaonense]